MRGARGVVLPCRRLKPASANTCANRPIPPGTSLKWGSYNVSEGSMTRLRAPQLRESYRVRVVRDGGQCRVVAVEHVRAGERLLRIRGVRTDRPSRYSLQIAADVHIVAGERPDAER